MGYNTIFKGEFKFVQELTASQLAKIKSFLGEDCRNHPEWNAPGLYYIDLVLLDDFSGLRWDDETEKTYDMVDLLNLIIDQMRKDIPEFGLRGKFLAQGEDIDDRYEIIIKDGRAVEHKSIIAGAKIMCPRCEEYFYLES